MQYTVGNFLDPQKETDETFDNFDTAYERFCQRTDETENMVVGLWEDKKVYAAYVAINGEIFKAQ